MKPAIILLMILVMGGAIVWLIDRLFYRKDDEAQQTQEADATEPLQPQGCADEACALRPVCPSEQLLEGACKQEIIYYEDEELDAFAGRGEDDYSDEEQEQWRDVLYTLPSADLLGWGQSIKQRGLVMPTAIREEFLQLAAEHHGPAGQ